MKCLVLGAAAGGGFPQWNCGCPNCQLARSGSPRALARSQASVAVSQDGQSWALIGASPDLRQQILASPQLAPAGPRHSPIACVVLLSADVDGMAGLLVLREQQPLRLYAPASILRILRENPIFASLDPALVSRIEAIPSQPIDTGIGLTLTLLEMPGKVPLYQENRAAAAPEPATTYAARLQSAARTTIIAPACADFTPHVRAHLQGADLLFFDGTLFTDNEMIAAGLGHKTGRRMGHIPVSGEGGSLAALAGHPGRRVYFHINNTNPMLLEDSRERSIVAAAGMEVAHDGMLIELT